MKTEFGTFGGGCFWGVEKFFQEIPGVIDAVSCYAGGDTKNPTYQTVCGGETGHAEVVNVEFDPLKITYAELLLLFIKSYGVTLTNNLESQSQYRSIVLYRTEIQKDIIGEVFTERVNSGKKRITTQVEPIEKFYEAEAYHQDYYGACRVGA
ncbi:MAG: peptide-methionine (S)-S-oxide reductase [Fluviicola sp.]|nr:MAG: peptide-methionine (S)-S-oxide reductase [Fluviicola sp.]